MNWFRSRSQENMSKTHASKGTSKGTQTAVPHAIRTFRFAPTLMQCSCSPLQHIFVARLCRQPVGLCISTSETSKNKQKMEKPAVILWHCCWAIGIRMQFEDRVHVFGPAPADTSNVVSQLWLDALRVAFAAVLSNKCPRMPPEASLTHRAGAGRGRAVSPIGYDKARSGDMGQIGTIVRRPAIAKRRWAARHTSNVASTTSVADASVVSPWSAKMTATVSWSRRKLPHIGRTWTRRPWRCGLPRNIRSATLLRRSRKCLQTPGYRKLTCRSKRLSNGGAFLSVSRASPTWCTPGASCRH